MFFVSISRFLGIILVFFSVEQGLVNISQQGRCCQAGHPDWKNKAHVRRSVAVLCPQRGAAGARPPARQVTGPGTAPADPPLAPASKSRTAEAEDLPNSSFYPSRPPPTGRPLPKRVPLVEQVLDFETAEHDGGFEAMAIELGDTPADYYGRVIGFRVHLCRFFLKECGNDPKDAYMPAVLAMRDSSPPGGLAAVPVELDVLSVRESVAGEGKNVGLTKWMLKNGAALRAAFLLSAGALSRAEVLAAGQITNASKSRIQETQNEVKDRGPRMLFGVIKTLMEFDAVVMSKRRRSRCRRGRLTTGRRFSGRGSRQRRWATGRRSRRRSKRC